jgi:hypothetical protein
LPSLVYNYLLAGQVLFHLQLQSFDLAVAIKCLDVYDVIKFNLYIEFLTYLTVRNSIVYSELESKQMKSNKKKNRNHHDMHAAAQSDKSNVHIPNEYKNKKIPLSTANASVKRLGPFPTSTKQMAGYFTVSGIENEISQAESEWPCFALKELPDNASDWLNDYYPVATINRSGSSVNHCKNGRRLIAIRIQIDQIPNDPDLTRIFRITVRNSNIDQIEVFGGGREGLEQIFDYTQWLSTKRYQNRMTAGSLGDYLKRHAGMGYASWNNIVRNNINYTNSNSDDDNIQWEEPLIFRFNGTEYKVFVYYDIYKGLPESVIKYAGKSDAIDYTEVECALPISRINCNGSNNNLPLFDKLYRYYNWYKIPKADIKFSLDMRYDIRHITEEDD